jgi:hypothetical protein
MTLIPWLVQNKSFEETWTLQQHSRLKINLNTTKKENGGYTNKGVL